MSDDARSSKGRRLQPPGEGRDAAASVPVTQRSGIKLTRTKAFDVWLRKLKYRRAAARIAERLERMEDGNLGDVKPLGDIWHSGFITGRVTACIH